ncbi:MAG: response regulator transcription factor [Gemmatimonadota bacterium]
MPKILVVEDEPGILMALEDDLALEGYAVESASDGISGFSLAREGDYQLIVLDVMLPGMDGYGVCRRLRQEGVETPILMLTARGEETDKVLGLELGADDYVTKPFSPRELVARIRALLRRTNPEAQTVDFFRFGDVEVDFRKYVARKAGVPLDLTRREFGLLRLLVERQHEALGRAEILDRLWEDPTSVFPRTVDVHVANLRKKIEDDPANPRWIVGVRGVGYRFAS